MTTCAFVLSSWREGALLAGSTLAAWLLLCDYFIAPRAIWWTEWMDRFAFIPVPLFGAVLIILIERRIILKRTGKGGPFLPVVLPEDRFAPSEWRRMFDVASKNCGSALTRRFFAWTRRGLAPLDPNVGFNHAEIFSEILIRRGKCMRFWAALLWLPACWVTLIVIPLKTNAMERIATFVNGRPVRTFDLIVVARERNGRVTSESLETAMDGSLGRVHTSRLGGGTLIIRATDFPRVYRRIEAVCGGDPPNCTVAEDFQSNSELHLAVPLRGGSSHLTFTQRIPEEPKLNMKLYFTRRDGVVLETVSIEPVSKSK